MNTPDSILEHETKYHANAWQEYSAQELLDWVTLLIKRSSHRTDVEKSAKDLKDASNYADMLMARLDHDIAEGQAKL